MALHGQTQATALWRRLAGVAYGGDYNPEQWPEQVWDEDVALMADSGVNLVSLAVFGWATLHPGPDEWDFGWLDKAMSKLNDAGVSVCLGTATASPAPWFSRQHPESLPVTEDGTRLWPGSRQHFCPSSQAYRAEAARIAEQLATRYREHPALAAWHVGNEYGCHVARCYCDASAAAFRQWLRARYGSVDALNNAWSTTFWSQRYTDFDEVWPPRRTPTFPNPAQQLDFARFSSVELIGCYLVEAQVLRRITPDVPLTTNFYPHWNLDPFEWAEHLDVVSYDSYPDPGDPASVVDAAIAYDIMRSARAGQPFVLLEQAPSAVNWRDVNLPKAPGRYRLGSMSALAHGANGVMSFQYRASRGGAEKFHSAFVPHAGPDTRTFRETRDLGRELRRLPPALLSASNHPDVALVMSWPSWWALDLPARPSSLVSQRDELRRWYEPLWRACIGVDVVPPDRDLSGYKLVIVPNLYLVDAGAATNLERYARSGGTLVVTYFSGVVDENDVVRTPGAFRDLTGVAVGEFWPLRPGTQAGVAFADGMRATGSIWTEDVTAADDVEVVARLADHELAGTPVVTRRRVDAGYAWYVATALDRSAAAHLVSGLVADTGVASVVAEASDGIEAGLRSGPDGDVLVVVNHADTRGVVQLRSAGTDVRTERRVADRVTVAARDVLVVVLDL